MTYSEDEMRQYLDWLDKIPDPGTDYPEIALIERYNATLPRRERYKPAIDYTSLHRDSISWRFHACHEVARETDPDEYDRGHKDGYWRQAEAGNSEAYRTGYRAGANKKTTEEDS